MGNSVQTWWWQAGGRRSKRHGMIVFRSRGGRREQRAGIDFDPVKQTIGDVMATIERQVTPAAEADDSLEVLVQIGDSPVLMSRESGDWARLARLGTALLHEAENFDGARSGHLAANRSASVA